MNRVELARKKNIRTLLDIPRRLTLLPVTIEQFADGFEIVCGPIQLRAATRVRVINLLNEQLKFYQDIGVNSEIITLKNGNKNSPFPDWDEKDV